MGRINVSMKAASVVAALAAGFALISGLPASGAGLPSLVANQIAIAPHAASPASSQVREFEHAASRALGGDLVYALYLPPGYDDGARRYPVLYLLHGAFGNHLEWLHSGYLQETLDAMIADGRVAPMIVVMPEAGNSWYVDSKSIGGPGDYETAIAADLVAEVDKTLRTKPDRWARGIGGLSMGGFGALRLAFHEPFRYGAAAAFSGAFWASVRPDTVLPARVDKVFAGAFGAPFAPARLIAANPLSMIDRLAEAKDPPAVFLTVGDRDRFKLYLETFEVFRRMRERGLPVEMRMTDGDHEWSTWAAELGDALLFFDRHFRRGS
jgi:S-formylglutathione hydrolase FrmB